MPKNKIQSLAAKHVSMAPSPAALVESLRSIGYTMETALADIIDNSISAGASEVDVRFDWNNQEPWIAIIDDGRGMKPDVLQTAMRFGSFSPIEERNVNDLGRFGLGMKTASISQCRNLTVCSKSGSQLAACQWNLDIIGKNSSDDWLLALIDKDDIADKDLLGRLTEEHLNDRDSGTIVLWRNLDTIIAGTDPVDSESKFSEVMNLARGHLETVFHRFLSPELKYRTSTVQILYNMSKLEAFNPFGPSVPARQELQEQEIRLEDERIIVQPYILPHRSKVSAADYDKYAGENGYLQNQGFYVYRNRRLIMKATWFRLIKKEELHKLVRVRIDIPNTLDHLWEINVNKSQVHPPDLVRKELKKIINRISNKGKKTQGRRGTVRLKKWNLVQAWSRKVINQTVEYEINEDHPLIEDLMESAPDPLKNKIKACLKLFAESFPRDLYYNDAADDGLEFKTSEEDSELTRTLCDQLIDALLKCGTDPKDLKNKIMKTEIPGVTEKLVEELTNNRKL